MSQSDCSASLKSQRSSAILALRLFRAMISAFFVLRSPFKPCLILLATCSTLLSSPATIRKSSDSSPVKHARWTRSRVLLVKLSQQASIPALAAPSKTIADRCGRTRKSAGTDSSISKGKAVRTAEVLFACPVAQSLQAFVAALHAVDPPPLAPEITNSTWFRSLTLTQGAVLPGPPASASSLQFTLSSRSPTSPLHYPCFAWVS